MLDADVQLLDRGSERGYDLGVITASHNPAQDNGFKITFGNNLPVGMGSGMEEIRDLATSDAPMPDAATRGGVEEDPGLLDRYVDAMWKLSGLEDEFEGWRISVDAGNGMDGYVLPKLTRKLRGADVRELYWQLDGNFPNHEANPLKNETLQDLIADVRKSGARFGAAFDGDGDRVGFVDENGEPIPGDILTALFAREILKDKPGGLVLYDVRSSWSVREAIEEAGGTAKMCKVGHANIKRQMREEGAVFAGELSMHFYFEELKGLRIGRFGDASAHPDVAARRETAFADLEAATTLCALGRDQFHRSRSKGKDRSDRNRLQATSFQLF
ncbi:MAG: hypothetical protein HND39_00030 [Ignavibacteriota bacterium]|nr:MAG: hypothetical protein HND39_00030 [Ignavibacteriota bacterium]